MAQTNPSDVFQLEVVAALVSEQLFANATLLNTGYIADGRKTAIRDGMADKIIFPKEVIVGANTGVRTNPKTGTPLTGDKLQFDKDEETVQYKMVPYDMDQTALSMLSALTDPNQFMADRVRTLVDVHIQKALIDKGVAGGTAYTEDATATTDVKRLKKAVNKCFGEKRNAFGAPLLVAHTNVVHDLEVSDEFMKVGLYNPNGPGLVNTGQITHIAGINILALDSVPVTNGLYSNLILLPGAIEFWPNEELGYGEQRIGHTTTWMLDWWFSYATHISARKPLGVIAYQCVSSLDQA